MKILILGGTAFLGRHLTDLALAAGHEVTHFNRGRRNPGLYPEVEHLKGDRNGDLSALKGRTWDICIDTSGYVPRIVKASAELLADSVGHYTFVSTISVYASSSEHNQDETAPVATLADPTAEEVTGETYGGLKALCEQAAEAAMAGRVLNIRPGLIVGPDDPSNRFTYWPSRVACGGEVLAPGRPDAPVQFIDVRDLSAFILAMATRGQTGVYNADGPGYRLTMGRFLDECKAAIGADGRFTWVPEQFLLEQGVAPWTEMPLWVPEADEGGATTNVAKAIAQGLLYRPLRDTIRDTLAWDRTLPEGTERRAGMKPGREAEVLRAWHAAE